MADAEIVTTVVTGDTSGFVRSMDAASKSAIEMKRQLVDLMTEFNDFEKAMNALKSSGLKVNLKVDSSAIDRAETDIKTLDGMSVDVDVAADTQRAEARIQSLDSATNKIEVPVSADTAKAEADIKAVDDNAPSPTIDVSADTAKAESAIKAVDDNVPSPKIKVDGDTSAIEAKLDQLRNIAVIDVILNVTQRIEDAPLLGGVAGRDKAEGTLQARTGLGANESAAAIEELYVNAYGDSADEIANNIALVEQLNLQTGNLASNTATAWDTASVAGEDFNSTLEVMDKLVKSGLATDFQQASDIIVGGIQSGANRSGDFLDTLREYSSVFEQGGYSAESAVNLMVQALEAGTFNTDKLGDTVKENILKITEAVGDVGGTGGTAKPILEKFDLLDDAALVGQSEEVGGITAETFAARFLQKLNEELAAGTIDTTEFNFDIGEVFGTPAEDLGFEIFKSLDFESAAQQSGAFEGLGAEAAQQINDNLSTAFTGLGRTVEIEIVDTLKEAGIDLNRLIDDAKTKAAELGTLIRGGTAIPEALEITLQMPGLAATLHNIESVMGNVYLAFLDIIARAMDLTGNTGGAAAVRETIADQGAKQLAFDIKLAGDADDALRLINIAEGRGVDKAAIGDAVGGAALELVNQGDLDRAQALLDIVNELPGATATFTDVLTQQAIELPLDISPEATEDEINNAIADAMIKYQNEGGTLVTLSANPTISFASADIDTATAQTVIDDAVNDLRTQFDTAMDSHNWADAFDIAKRLKDEGGMNMATDQARQTGEDIVNALAEGINLLNPFDEDETPTGFISDDMQKQIDGTIPDWRKAIKDTSPDLLNMGIVSDQTGEQIGDLDDKVSDADLTVAIFGVTVDTTMATARDNMAAYTPDIILWLAKIRDAGIEASNALGKVVVPGGTPPSTGGTGAGAGTSGSGNSNSGGGGGGENGISTEATGGTFSGWSFVGEQGMEMLFADEEMAVWNNNTTMAFLAGTQIGSDLMADAGANGGGSVYNDNRTFNVNTNNSNYGAAQRGSSDARIAKAVKGF